MGAGNYLIHSVCCLLETSASSRGESMSIVANCVVVGRLMKNGWHALAVKQGLQRRVKLLGRIDVCQTANAET